MTRTLWAIVALLVILPSCFSLSSIADVEDYQDLADYARKVCRTTAKRDFPSNVNGRTVCDLFGVIVADIMDTTARNICDTVSGISEHTAIRRAKEFPFVWTIEHAISDTVQWMLAEPKLKEQAIKLEFTKKIMEPWMNLCSNTKSGINIRAPEGSSLDPDYIDRLTRTQNERLRRERPELKDHTINYEEEPEEGDGFEDAL
ncbi:hypothetical protein GEMRC1_004707 [Eukaryota sp. GEM-RC1]